MIASTQAAPTSAPTRSPWSLPMILGLFHPIATARPRVLPDSTSEVEEWRPDKPQPR